MPDGNSSTKVLRDACEAAISKALFDCGEELRAEGAKFGTATALLEEVARRVAHGETVAALLDVAEAAQEMIDKGGEHDGPCLNYEGQEPGDLDEYDSCYLHLAASGARHARLRKALDLLPQGEPE